MKDKRRHTFNRVYLLSAVFLSLLMPLVEMPSVFGDRSIFRTTSAMLNPIRASVDNGFQEKSSIHWLFVIYIAISFFLISKLMVDIYRLIALKKSGKPFSVENFKVIQIDAGLMPFTFLSTIYWPEDLYLNEDVAGKIFRHESCHAREKHSLDILFCNVVIAFYWINPIFYFIKRELAVVHEFSADSRALEPGDTSTFAAMMLQTFRKTADMRLPSYYYKSALKRRLLMVQTKKESPAFTARLLLCSPALLAVTLSIAGCTSKSESLMPANTVVDASGYITSATNPNSLYVDIAPANNPGAVRKGWIKIIRSTQPKVAMTDSLYVDLSTPTNPKGKRALIRF